MSIWRWERVEKLHREQNLGRSQFQTVQSLTLFSGFHSWTLSSDWNSKDNGKPCWDDFSETQSFEFNVTSHRSKVFCLRTFRNFHFEIFLTQNDRHYIFSQTNKNESCQKWNSRSHLNSNENKFPKTIKSTEKSHYKATVAWCLYNKTLRREKKLPRRNADFIFA